MHCSTSGTGLVLLPSNGTSCDRYDHGSFRVSKNQRWAKKDTTTHLWVVTFDSYTQNRGYGIRLFREVFKIASRSGDLGWVELEAAKAPIFFG